MIKRLLRQLRKQSKTSRDNVALVTAGTLTALVAMMWLYHAPTRLSIQESGTLSSAKEESSFWQLFSDFGSQMASVKDFLPELQDTLTNETFDEALIGTRDSQSFYNSADPAQENSVGEISTSTGFLAPERTVSGIPPQPIRIIAVTSSTTVTSTTSESW